ncbi:unnamed protein product [Musa acuminata subsp. malaccensis]|uniref:(wild Malaysian banana) hypothetical protein n=1 Tax=Musa acuminata subsp. malaccensis TaxID=214687 RepID=A0A804J8P2_MUSAM|nr:unnamed protein product [Musa acuminata subsp. malaccensis]
MYVHARLYSSQPHVLHYIYISVYIYVHHFILILFCFSCMHHHLVSGFSVFDCCSKNYVLNLMKMSVLIAVLKISLMIVYQTRLLSVRKLIFNIILKKINNSS